MANAEYIDDYRLNTAREFLDQFAADEYQPSGPLDTLEPGYQGFIFRGQVDSDWPLLPRAFRPGELWDHTPQPPFFSNPEDETQRRGHLGDHVFEELAAVRRFLETADALGLPTPIDYHLFRSHDEHIHRLWNEKDDSYCLPFPDEKLWPAFALAQHHGVLTRFLDWTESPFVAAYFAAYEASIVAEATRPCDQQRIAVFRLSTYQLDKDPNLRLVRAPRFNNGFLLAQKGVFTVVPTANQRFYETGDWPSVNDIVGVDGVTRLSIPASEANALLRLLYRHDISRHHVMPTLDHAARAVEYSMQLFGHKNHPLDPTQQDGTTD